MSGPKDHNMYSVPIVRQTQSIRVTKINCYNRSYSNSITLTTKRSTKTIIIWKIHLAFCRISTLTEYTWRQRKEFIYNTIKYMPMDKSQLRYQTTSCSWTLATKMVSCQCWDCTMRNYLNLIRHATWNWQPIICHIRKMWLHFSSFKETV